MFIQFSFCEGKLRTLDSDTKCLPLYSQNIMNFLKLYGISCLFYKYGTFSLRIQPSLLTARHVSPFSVEFLWLRHRHLSCEMSLAAKKKRGDGRICRLSNIVRGTQLQFLPKYNKNTFQATQVLNLHLQKCILRGATKIVPVRSSRGTRVFSKLQGLQNYFPENFGCNFTYY